MSSLINLITYINKTIKSFLTTILLAASLFSTLAMLSQTPVSSTIKELLSTVSQPLAVSAVGNCTPNTYIYVGNNICRRIFTVLQLADASYPCTVTTAGSYLYSVSNHVGTCYHDIAPTSFTCPAGEYLFTQGTDSCTPCDAGYYCVGGNGTAAVKAVCGPGYYCVGGNAAQVICPAGFYCGFSINRYKAYCTSTTSLPGSTSCTIPVACIRSQYLDSSTCRDCPAGFSCDLGTTTPTSCLAGTYCPLGNFYGFKDCPAGSYCPSSASAPTQCSPNNYCPGSSSVQTPCPAGTSSIASTGSLEGCIPNSCPTGQTLTAGVCALLPKSYGDVKYLSPGLPNDSSVVATPGGTVTQRVYYDNTTESALTDVSVKTSLPSGFSYIPGSLKHCKEPTEAETTCDTQSPTTRDGMFTKLTTTGISPAAGFYDATDTGSLGTSPTATTGILDAGKKRYLNMGSCRYENDKSSLQATTGFSTFIPESSKVFGQTIFKALNNSVKGEDCHQGTYLDPLKYGGNGNFEIGVSKKFYFSQCLITYPASGIPDQYYSFNIWTPGSEINAKTYFSNDISFTGNSCSIDSPLVYTIVPSNSGYQSTQILTNRYLNFSQCTYRDSAYRRITNLLSTTPNSANGFSSQFGASNTPITAYNCGPGNAQYFLEPALSAYKAIDMLDTSRAKGYYEYKMIVPETGLASSYSVPVTISAKTYGAGVNGSGGIAVTPVVTTGTINVISTNLRIKVNLAGAFDKTSGVMTNKLRVNPSASSIDDNLLPTFQPFGVSGLGSGSGSTLSYTGTETLPPIPSVSNPASNTTLIPDVVDWVLVEVRDTTAANGGAGNVLSSKAGLLKTDGTIVDAINATTANSANLGVEISGLTASGDYKVSVRHRNHLGISTSTPVTLTLGGFRDLDFTNNVNVKSNNQANVGIVGPIGTLYSSTAAPGTTGSYIYGLRAADTDGNGQVDATDRNILITSDEYDGIYDNKDLNLDGVIDASDRNMSQNTGEASGNL